ncbi:hypothetical protein C5167_040605 [Papaver somniferum]|uniref:Uncharacterized protein n=1 Tax=Papaver somniferum TaxID=3469 RepID=A0A4Y7IJM9_PAPSO|nr:hypothetical protein C5167_040605 [Papaver somniferum]
MMCFQSRDRLGFKVKAQVLELFNQSPQVTNWKSFKVSLLLNTMDCLFHVFSTVKETSAASQVCVNEYMGSGGCVGMFELKKLGLNNSVLKELEVVQAFDILLYLLTYVELGNHICTQCCKNGGIT